MLYEIVDVMHDHAYLHGGGGGGGGGLYAAG